MKHYVITKIAVWKKEWFKDTLPLRNKIFKDYLLPSIQEQECQDFEWLLLIDEDMDIWTIEFYKDYWTIIITKGWQWRDNVCDYIKNNNSIWETILTTRLDSDDFINPWFVKTICNYYKQWEPLQLLTLCTWAEMDYNTKDIYLFERKYSNPFITLKEIHPNIESVYHLKHWEMEQEYQTKYIFTDQPLWCRILHWYNAARKEVLDKSKKLSN